jgi:hypothetical protein
MEYGPLCRPSIHLFLSALQEKQGDRDLARTLMAQATALGMSGVGPLMARGIHFLNSLPDFESFILFMCVM